MNSIVKDNVINPPQASALVPGPNSGLFGLKLIQPFQENALTFLGQVATYGDFVHFRLGPVDVYFINDADYIHQVMVEDADKYNKPRVNKQVFAKLLGNGLLLSDGDFWRRQRRLMQPAFHHKRIDAYAQTTVQKAEQFLTTWKGGDVRDVQKEMQKLTLNIVTKALFDIEDESFADRINEVAQLLQVELTRQARSLINLDWLPTPRNSVTLKNLKVLHDIIDEIIAERRKNPHDRGDLLSMLMLARDEDGSAMSDKEIHDEAITLFLAGHDTTALSLSWAWYLLAKHPEVEAKLYDELKTVLNGRTPTLSDLPNLSYTNKIINETLRLYPPAYIFGREPNQDVVLGNQPIKKNSLVIFTSYLVHRKAAYYPDPEQFNPDRFNAEFEKTLPKYAYLPFGGGPHICIGKSFALMETALILATVAQRFRLELTSPVDIQPVPLVTLCMSDKLGMKLTAR